MLSTVLEAPLQGPCKNCVEIAQSMTSRALVVVAATRCAHPVHVVSAVRAHLKANACLFHVMSTFRHAPPSESGIGQTSERGLPDMRVAKHVPNIDDEGGRGTLAGPASDTLDRLSCNEFCAKCAGSTSRVHTKCG